MENSSKVQHNHYDNHHEPNLVDKLEKELIDKKLIKGCVDREILNKVDVIGFDIDHTLSLYHHEELIELLYTSFARYLVEDKHYPKILLIYNKNENKEDEEEINAMKHIFNDELVLKLTTSEVLMDSKNGNVLKIDENKVVIKAFHGIDELTEEEIIKSYGINKEYSTFNFEQCRSEDYCYLVGNFESHVIPLFMFCIHLYDEGKIKFDNEDVNINNYKRIFEDVLQAFTFNYNLLDDQNKILSFKDKGYFYPEFYKNPKKYLYDYSAKELLTYLKNKGLNIFFATNSFYEYGDFILRNSIGEVNYILILRII
jgi:hypothetical protein